MQLYSVLKSVKKKSNTLKKLISKMNDKSEGKKEVIGSGLGRDWSELNREYLIDILSRLSLEERWSGPMLVCKPWMYACDDPSLNSVFDLYTWFRIFGIVTSLSRRLM